ncbi:MAG: NTP transferase domain-containing protein [Clostridiales bacterium]|nr:NTP transferase domain-containing protein [Clostridiales bacterium]HAW16054.1 nucleotidyltransferase family protein [Clostridiales bacterium]
MIAILLAAGYATRLYPLTKDKPKSLLPLGSRLIIDYIMDSVDKISGLSKVVIITNDLFADQFSSWAEGLDREGKAPVVVLNDGTTDDTNKRGAIGDIKFTIDQLGIDEDVCILAGDNIFTYSIENMQAFFNEKKAPTLIAINVPELHQRQKLAVAVLDDDCRVLDMEEKPVEPKSEWGIYATYFYGKDILPLIDTYLEEGNSPDAPGNFPSWLYKRMPVYAFKGDGECIDIGTLENYEKTCKEYENR